MTGRIEFASSSEDEFPDLDVIFQRSKKPSRIARTSVQELSYTKHEPSRLRNGNAAVQRTASTEESPAEQPDGTNAPSTVRRRRLGRQPDNPLLRPFNAITNSKIQGWSEAPARFNKPPSRKVREPRRRQHVTAPAGASWDNAEESHNSTGEAGEITDAGISDFFDNSTSNLESEDEPTLSGPQLPSKSRPRRLYQPQHRQEGKGRAKPSTKLEDEVSNIKVISFNQTDDLITSLRRLDLTMANAKSQGGSRQEDEKSCKTPPSTPPKRCVKTLISPEKLPSMPKTPHNPNMDLFWSQEFVDEWNEEHSPKKLVLPPAPKSPTKSPKKSKGKGDDNKTKETKKSFEKRKHDIAEAFLRELDETVTDGKLQLLAESTGGIKIKWSSKLNTTAGRANWKRETVRNKLPDGSERSATQRHHASIELAEKVIDDENRLLNVVAHEFCHLANFMVSGITGNPHGKEFKVWAAKCSRAFGHRGIEVMTKHSYEIDFKYKWECTECGLEYKRHSKSVNPERHRCGSCKGQLKQTKPTPRMAAKPSEYQLFLKEQMKVVREQHPKSPQREIMKIIADKWAKRGCSNRATPESDHPVSATEIGVKTLSFRLDSIAL